ncbi:MAG TPA: DUF1127 domain-containing protein [Casimicrobiaceae bacterium]|jgi:uncharacterized protein YjiS (DUF1127 family)
MRDDTFVDAPVVRAAGIDDPALRDLATALWRRFVDWRAAARRSRRDRDDLAQMTERELRDIGVCMGDMPAAADVHWMRDWPR